MKYVVSLLLACQLVFLPFKAYSEDFISTTHEGKPYFLVLPDTIQKMSKDIELGEQYKEKLDILKDSILLTDSQLEEVQNQIMLFNQKQKLYLDQIDLLEEHNYIVEGLYKSEVAENERLRLKEPCKYCWLTGGFVGGVITVFLASMVVKNVK